MDDIKELLGDLDTTDLHALSAEEKVGLFQLLKSTCRVAEPQHIFSNNEGKSKFNHQIDEALDQVLQIHNSLLKATGHACSDPESYRNFLSKCPTQDDQRSSKDILLDHISLLGLEYSTPTPGNGNCFFEAISDQLERLGYNKQSAADLRRNSVAYCKQNPVIQRNDGLVNLKDFVEGGDLTKYLDKMSRNGEWADHVMVMAMASFLKTEILVVTSNPGANLEESLIWIHSGNSNNNVLLLGHIYENHYQSLRPIAKQTAATDEHSQENQCQTEIRADGDYEFESSEEKTQESMTHYIQGNDSEFDSLEEHTEDNMTHYIQDHAFVNFVRTTKVKDMNSEVDCFIHRVRPEDEEEDIMTTYLLELDTHANGVFSHRFKYKTTTQFRCERSAKPRGKKRGPKQTVANECKAYVSFQFVTHFEKKAVIIRQKLCHTGHNLKDSMEKHVSKPDQLLVEYVNSLLKQNKKPMEIICKTWKWARDHGKHDIHDRRYFLTPADIKNMTQKHRCQQRYHHRDVLAVHELCSNVLNEKIVFYQQLQEDESPLVVIYQNEAQRERMKTLARYVVFLDATYKGLTSYGYVFYTLLARNDHDRGTPLAYCIASEDTSDIVKIFLEKLQQSARRHGFTFCPRSFMVDRDSKEIGAISTVFPNTCILLCWFHVLQAIYRYLNKKDSGISGPNNAIKRKKVIEYIRLMKLCAKKDEFMEKVRTLHEIMPTKEVTKYLHDNWCNEKWGARWANFGRQFFHEDHDTNNLVERFFLAIKYHFLGGYNNQRIDELLLLIDGHITDFYDYMDELAKHGRMKNLRTVKERRGKTIAENMLQAGFGDKIQWISSTECFVPSQTTNSTHYEVDCLTCFCTCPASTQGGFCKHVHLALLMAASRNVDIEKERQMQAQWIYSTGNYYYDNDQNQIEVLSAKGDISVVNIETMSCSCFANSHGVNCFCLLVMEMIQPVISMPDTSIEIPIHIEPIPESTDQAIIKHLDEINLFMQSDRLHDLSEKKKQSILQSLRNVKQCCFSDFRKKTHKRKQVPLNINRKGKSNDHEYSLGNRQKVKKVDHKVNDDGSFKKSSRSKGFTRTNFV